MDFRSRNLSGIIFLLVLALAESFYNNTRSATASTTFEFPGILGGLAGAVQTSSLSGFVPNSLIGNTDLLGLAPCYLSNGK